jgi:dGTPase
MAMVWSRLLSPQRLGRSQPEALGAARTPFQRDFDRLIFSAAFRRLKDKTQVFSLSRNDSVRTRLIHSLEVASVGRSLGRVVGEAIAPPGITAADIGDIVAAACIAHDIGNPPFGHSGENALRSGFQTWFNRQSQPPSLTAAQRADLENFEGNAQGFRILARLEMPHRLGGLQLTCPTIAAFAKYPQESLLVSEPMPGKGKYGFFQADRALFQQVAETVGLMPQGTGGLAWCRHPLTYLVEAADDICYSIVDIEDGYQMGYLEFAEVVALLNPIAQLDLDREPGAELEQVTQLRSKAIDLLVREAAANFLAREAEILGGLFSAELLTLSRHQEALQAIHQRARRAIFQHPDVVGVQIAGYEVLGKLFWEFAEALGQPELPKSKLVLRLLPGSDDRGLDMYQQLLGVTDFIAGMTDSYATRLFQQFAGISLL